MPVSRSGRKYLSTIPLVAKRLKEEFKDFDHYNKKNPLNELIFILCSLTTTYPVYVRTYAALRRRYRTYAEMVRAPASQIAKTIFEGGQYTQKAKVIKSILKTLTLRFGRPTLAPLGRMDDQACESFLVGLHGVGKKVARCVMLYSLGRNVFPIDTHCYRIATRLGWISKKKSIINIADSFQSSIPPELRFSLHVNLISLGREYCGAKFPSCGKCPLDDLCPKVGISRTYETN